MKKLCVSEKCNGCGQCVMETDLLTEDSKGNAVAVDGKFIDELKLSDIKRIVSECPVGALFINEVSSTSKKGKAGLNELLAKLESKYGKYSILSVPSSEFKFNPKDYYIPVPHSPNEYRRNYNSRSSARSAASSDFSKMLYSESAYRPILKKIFVEYKMKVLSPYMTCTESKESYYYTINSKIEKELKDIYAEACSLCDGKFALPKEWADFKVYPSQKQYSPIYFVEHFEDRSTSSGIIAEMKSSSYTQLSYYVDQMDYDYDEIYVGRGVFGDKTKEMWYFSGFSEAAKEYIDDLMSAITGGDPGIEENAADAVREVLAEYNKNVQETLKTKIEQFKKIIG